MPSLLAAIDFARQLACAGESIAEIMRQADVCEETAKAALQWTAGLNNAERWAMIRRCEYPKRSQHEDEP